jgi:hypothetical protein
MDRDTGPRRTNALTAAIADLRKAGLGMRRLRQSQVEIDPA